MKAIVVREAGGPLEIEEMAKPLPGRGQVLVRVQSACINPVDNKIRDGAATHARQPLPAVLGLDMAGVVEAVGDDVTGFASGDEVYGMVGGVGGWQGTLAEYVCAPSELLAQKPSVWSMHQASVLPLVTITGWEGLIDRAKVQKDHRILVHAGAGGVGHVAVQLAKAVGAEVFATVSAEKSDAVADLGATPILYKQQSVSEYVERYTQGEGFDIVYDTVGGTILDESFLAAKRYTGHVVSCLGWGTRSHHYRFAARRIRESSRSCVADWCRLRSSRRDASASSRARAARQAHAFSESRDLHTANHRECLCCPARRERGQDRS